MLNSIGKTLAMDIEADGLLNDATKVWCIVAQDVEDGRMYLFHDSPQFDLVTVFDPSDKKEYTIPKRDGSLTEGAAFLSNAKKLVCHNYFGYDYFMLKKFFPKQFKAGVLTGHDTLVQSKIQWFDRPVPKGCKGQHGLQAWGARQGVLKPEVNDWTTMDTFKLHRCIQDVVIQTGTFNMLEKEREKIEERVGATLEEAFWTECRYRFYCTQQELHGTLIDVEHVKECIKELDIKLDELKAKIEPFLPPTIKVKSVRESAHEVAKALGYTKLPPIRYQTKQLNGEVKKVPIKKYYKPTTKYLSSEKEKIYSVVEKATEEVIASGFDSLKSARQYVRDRYNPKNLTKWKFPSEVVVTYFYNDHTCNHFDIEPERYNDDRIIDGPFTKVEFNESKMSQHEVIKKYLATLGWKPMEWTFKKDAKGKLERAAERTKIVWPENALKEHQVVITVGRGQPIPNTPKLTEKSFESLPEGIGKRIAEYNTYSHRRKYLQNPTKMDKGILNNIRKDSRISAGVNNFGTATGRASHYQIVNLPGDGALFGKEMRQMVIAPEGRQLVGVDQRSAQLSIAAYYANNYDYYKAVAEGQEIKTDENGTELIHPLSGQPWYLGESGHCVNARAFTLVTDEEWKRAVDTQDPELIRYISLLRKKSKGGSFATIFGASGKKVAQTLGIDETLGEEKRTAFLENIGLGEVIQRLGRMVKKNKRGSGGYIEIPFGYYVFCNQEHKFFNYLDQGTEGAVQKYARNLAEQRMKHLKRKNKAAIILDMHDELLAESDEDYADEVGQIIARCYTDAAEDMYEWHKKRSKWFTDLNFAIDLSSGYKVGKTYYDVH